MFNQARLKLTAYYLLIIMTISFLFSAFIYRQLTDEFDRILRIEKSRLERQAALESLADPLAPKRIIYINPDVIEESKTRILWMLIVVNAGILTLSAAAGYFLAGRTLKPIQEMMDLQNQFVTDASHELRTPLTALKTEIEVGLRDNKLTLTEARKMLQSNLEEVNSLQQLSESLMKLSQNSSNLKKQYIQSLSIKDEIQTSIKKITPLSKIKKININYKGKESIVLGEEGSISELITILLDNAVKYSSPNTEVLVRSRTNDGHAIIEVEDQGVGISKEDISHIFDRFYRSDKSRNKKQIDGFGLGLSIAQRIVKNLNGKIDVHSEENQGTTFIITLPCLKNV